ncbi:hypothetical protein WME98_49995 [Sorangium sp. So ce296]|uniref:hypothetical protein n=1 Tax=Sorangium sp. So ce296 TaxID=3133296 RepID=UPI003F633061
MGLYHNGNYHNHASAEIDCAGKPFLGITTLNYSDELEKELQYGTGSIALGVSQGQYKPNADMEMLKSEWERMKAVLPQNGFGEFAFNIGATYKEASGTIVDELRTVYITKVEDASQQGPSANKVKLTLCVAEPIRHNGATLVKVKERPRLALRT